MGSFFSKSRTGHQHLPAPSGRNTRLASSEQNVSIQENLGNSTVARVNRYLQDAHPTSQATATRHTSTYRQKAYWLIKQAGYWSTGLVYASAPALYSYLFVQDDEQEDAWRVPVGIIVAVGSGLAYGMLASLSLDDIKAELSETAIPLLAREKQRHNYPRLKRSAPVLIGLASAITASHITYEVLVLFGVPKPLGFLAPYFTYHVAVDAVEKLSEALGLTNPTLIAALSYLFGICAYSSWGALASEGTARSFGRTFDVISAQCVPQAQRNRPQLYVKRGITLFCSALSLGLLSLVPRLEILDRYTDSSPFMKFVILCNIVGPGNAYFWAAYDFLAGRLNQGNHLARQRIALVLAQVDRLLNEVNDAVINELVQQQSNKATDGEDEKADRVGIDSITRHSMYGSTSVDVPVAISLEPVQNLF